MSKHHPTSLIIFSLFSLPHFIDFFTQTNQQHGEEKAALLSQLQESEAALAQSHSQVASLREELHSLTKVQSELQKTAAEEIIKRTEVSPPEVDAHFSLALYMCKKC